MNTAIYVRVSTDKQEASNQLLQLREYCEKSGYSIYSEFVDIISGKEKSRPEYDKLFQEAHQKKFDLVLFWDLSRFSRSGTLFTLQKLTELDNLGIKWHSFNEPYVSTFGQFKEVVIALLASIAKAERDKISDRTKAGLERALKQGKKLGRPQGSRDKKVRNKAGYYLKKRRVKKSASLFIKDDSSKNRPFV